MTAVTRNSPDAANGRPPHAASWSPELRRSQVYEQILLDVILGRLAPGARLDEQVLARDYDAGLAGVRDALGRLSLEGLVIRRPRSGTHVSDLDASELHQCYEARALIEPHCAALAAANATESQVCDVLMAFDGGEAAALNRDYPTLVAMDQHFHAAVARASGNRTLADVLIPLQHKAARFWVYSLNSSSVEERIADITLHRIVAARIAAHDVDGARQAMCETLGTLPSTLARVAANGELDPS